jgi:hypothetical protein
MRVEGGSDVHHSQHPPRSLRPLRVVGLLEQRDGTLEKGGSIFVILAVDFRLGLHEYGMNIGMGRI